MTAALSLDVRWLRQGTKTGDCLTVLPFTVNGMELGDQEWHNTLFLCYGMEPPDAPNHCGGCNAKFYISHSLDCKKVGIINTLHNKLYDGVAELSGKYFTPLHVHDDPLIHQGRVVREGKAQTAGYPYKNPPETTENSYQKG